MNEINEWMNETWTKWINEMNVMNDMPWMNDWINEWMN